MAQIERSILTKASPETVFRIYRDVEHWNRWDPDTRSSHLSGGLTLGANGHLTPARGRTVPMQVTAVVDNRGFTVTSRTALFRMDFEHELEPFGDGTRIAHWVRFAGMLKPLLVLIVGQQLKRGLPVTLHQLKQLAESVQAQEHAGRPPSGAG